MDYSAYSLLPPSTPTRSLAPSIKSSSSTIRRFLTQKHSPLSRRKRSQSISALSSDTSPSPYASILSSPLSSPSKNGAALTYQKPLPRLPPKENEECESLLSSAVQELQEDYVSGARQMADSALSNLASLMELAAETARDRGELWGMGGRAARELSRARPSMSAAITSTLLRALDSISHIWTTSGSPSQTAKTPTELARIASHRIEEILRERKDTTSRLCEHFTNYLRTSILKPSTKTIHILTLSASSTILSAIQTLITTLSTAYLPPHFAHPSANPSLLITILESRPRCEGADMASQILSSVSTTHAYLHGKVHVRAAPDCAVGSLFSAPGVQNSGFPLAPESGGSGLLTGTGHFPVDILLLGADKISSEGDVSNKIGSLSAALCARHLSPQTKVVVLSETDKIAPSPPTNLHIEAEGDVHHEYHPSMELSPAWSQSTRENLRKAEKEGIVQVHGEWFETVPKAYVHRYVTERGVLDTQGVEDVAWEVEELRRKVLGE